MASDPNFVQFIIDQVAHIGSVTHKKMFGEYGLYVDEKIVALVCDDQLFIKPTEAGRAYMGQVVEAPAYPGAKPSFLIESLDDAEWLGGLFRVTAAALPAPKPKKTKAQPKPTSRSKCA